MNHDLSIIDVGTGRRRGPLTTFPVWIDLPSIPGIVWKTDDLAVGELPTGPSVSHLLVENPADRPTLLLEGDLLAGGMQHRMAASSTLLAANESTPVDVLCVEQGRWSGSGPTARPAAVPATWCASAAWRRCSAGRAPRVTCGRRCTVTTWPSQRRRPRRCSTTWTGSTTSPSDA